MTVLYSKKICLIGDISVGKTSLVRRFIESRFDENYLSTIGVTVSRKALAIQLEKNIAEMTLLIWDFAGGEQFNRVVRNYYQGASGAFFVCDVTRSTSIEAISHYVEQFIDVNPGRPSVILANKIDLVSDRTAHNELMKAQAEKLGAPWFTTSAKTGENVESAFRMLAERLLT